jgi:PAS domain S-box-containing protein
VVVFAECGAWSLRVRRVTVPSAGMTRIRFPNPCDASLRRSTEFSGSRRCGVWLRRPNLSALTAPPSVRRMVMQTGRSVNRTTCNCYGVQKHDLRGASVAAFWAPNAGAAGREVEGSMAESAASPRRIAGASDTPEALAWIARLEAELADARLQAQREADERQVAERRFDDVAALSVDWIWETDAALRYTYMSDRVEQVTGLAVSQYVGHSRVEMLGETDVDPFLQSHIEDLTAHRPFSDLVQWINRPRGLVCISVSGRPRFDGDGRFLGYIGIGRDVTEEQTQRRRQEDMNHALAEARDQALRASKSKSSFLAHMSHELRTPMNAILGFAEVMKEQIVGPLDDRYRGYAGHIYDSAQHLLSLINDVLDLSKIEAGAYELHEEAVDVAGTAARAMRLVEGAARHGAVTLAQTMPQSLPPVWADQRAVFQIILNLLTNAVKFTPAGGRVEAFAGREAGGGVSFGVKDSGIGMSEAEIGKALQRFGQVDNVMTREQQGSGLGLPLVQELVLLHGGNLTVESVPGAGTTVTVHFGVDRVPSA